jgi:hypothetical protein
MEVQVQLPVAVSQRQHQHEVLQKRLQDLQSHITLQHLTKFVNTIYMAQ